MVSVAVVTVMLTRPLLQCYMIAYNAKPIYIYNLVDHYILKYSLLHCYLQCYTSICVPAEIQPVTLSHCYNAMLIYTSRDSAYYTVTLLQCCTGIYLLQAFRFTNPIHFIKCMSCVVMCNIYRIS